jgi:hypothetical protein
MTATQIPLAPLIALVDRLREELSEAALEAKRRKLALAEATLELLLSQQHQAAHSSEEGESGATGPLGAEGVLAQDQPLSQTQASEGWRRPRPSLAREFT